MTNEDKVRLRISELSTIEFCNFLVDVGCPTMFDDTFTKKDCNLADGCLRCWLLWLKKEVQE